MRHASAEMFVRGLGLDPEIEKAMIVHQKEVHDLFERADAEIEKLKAALRACHTAAEGLRKRHEEEAVRMRNSVVADLDAAERHWCAEDACSEIVKAIADEMSKVDI